MKTRSETISFRADPDLLKQIDGECARFGISRGSWVRGVTIAHLHLPNNEPRPLDFSPLDDKLTSLEQLLDSLKSDVARSLYFVLTKIGNLPSEQARELIRAKFLERERE